MIFKNHPFFYGTPRVIYVNHYIGHIDNTNDQRSYNFPSYTLWPCHRTSTGSYWPSSPCTRMPPSLSKAPLRLRPFGFSTMRRTHVCSCAGFLLAIVRRPSYGPQQSAIKQFSITINDQFISYTTAFNIIGGYRLLDHQIIIFTLNNQ